MIDWLFRITSIGALANDLDAFCNANGYPLLTVDDGTGGRTIQNVAFGPHIRFDFDIFTLVSAGKDRGLHVNARGTAVPEVASAALVLSKLDADLRRYFSAENIIINAPPSPLVGGQSWHSTGFTTLIDPVPVQQKRIWL